MLSVDQVALSSSLIILFTLNLKATILLFHFHNQATIVIWSLKLHIIFARLGLKNPAFHPFSLQTLESRVTKLPRSLGQCCRYLGGGYRCSHRRDRDARECSSMPSRPVSSLQSPHKSGMRGEEFRQMRYCFCAVNITGPSRITCDTLRKYGIEFQNEKRSVKS